MYFYKNLLNSLVIILTCSLVISCLPKNTDKQDGMTKKINITGHRGVAGYRPENTISSVLLALENKTDRIEIDIQRTKDSIIILMHDNSLNRTTTGKGLCKEFTYDQIRNFKIVSKTQRYFEDEKVPSLEEIMQLINGKSILIIDVKNGRNYYPGIEKQITSLIEKYNAGDCKMNSV